MPLAKPGGEIEVGAKEVREMTLLFYYSCRT